MALDYKFANSYAAVIGVATYTPMTDAFNALKPSNVIAIARPTPTAMVTFALPTPNAIVRTFFTKSEASWTKSGDM